MNMWTSGEILTASRIEDVNSKNSISGYVGLGGGSGYIWCSTIPNIYWQYWNGSWGEMSAVTGTWSRVIFASQTFYDNDLISSATGGYIYNTTTANNDEVCWSNLKMPAGQYEIKVMYRSTTAAAKLWLYHGTNNIGYVEMYSPAPDDNNETYLCSYNLTVNRTQDFRLVLSSKSAGSSDFEAEISKVEIRRI